MDCEGAMRTGVRNSGCVSKSSWTRTTPTLSGPNFCAATSLPLPARVSFVPLPLSPPFTAFSGEDLNFSSFYAFFCFDPPSSSDTPLALHALLPSPFSSTSLSSFFPVHVWPHSTALSEASFAPSSSVSLLALPSHRRTSTLRRSRASTVKLVSLATLASSVQSFFTAEEQPSIPLGVGSSESLKEPRRNNYRDNVRASFGWRACTLSSPLPWNWERKAEVSAFSNCRLNGCGGIRKVNLQTALKRRSSDGYQDDLESRMQETQGKALQTSKHLMAGAIAAIVSRTVVAPLERLKLEYIVRGAKESVVDTVRTILVVEGLKGFWKGNFVNLLRTTPFKSVNFYAFDVFRKQVLRFTGRAEVTNIERLAAGAAAGVTATILCFPLDTVRTRMVARGGEQLGGIIGCFRHMVRTEGFLSLYRGLVPAIVSIAPAGAVFYGVYDMLKTSYLRSPHGQAMLRARAKADPRDIGLQLELGPMRTLLFGAIAGACAESVTYPFEVVRRQLQMQQSAHTLGVFGVIQNLIQKGGIGACYAGLLPSTLQVLPSAALSYFVYETMKIALKIP